MQRLAKALLLGCIAGLVLGSNLAIGLSAPSTSPVAPAGSERPVRALLDLSGYEDQTEPLPAHAPAPAQATGIGPGSHLIITMPGGTFGCTANFVWTGNGKTFLGAAGHCFLPETKTATHGPGADYNPSATTVRVCVAGCNFGGELGFVITGTLATLGPVAYARQTQSGVDVGNDFGIVEIPSSLASQIRTAMPVWGGPTTTETLSAGKIVCHYGNGVAVGEVYPTMARAGVGIFGGTGASWGADTPAAFGDSGSALNVCAQDAGGVHGRGAVGILTHLGVNTGFVLGTTMSRAIAMATQAGLTISVSLA